MLKKTLQSTILSDGSLTYIPATTFQNKNVLVISTLDTATHRLWHKSKSRTVIKNKNQK
jgi:hypothetical protein